jgi:hypothetical protein
MFDAVKVKTCERNNNYWRCLHNCTLILSNSTLNGLIYTPIDFYEQASHIQGLQSANTPYVLLRFSIGGGGLAKSKRGWARAPTLNKLGQKYYHDWIVRVRKKVAISGLCTL